MSEYDTVVRGSLKLKGCPVKGSKRTLSGGIKKAHKAGKCRVLSASLPPTRDLESIEYTKTPAELAFEKVQKARQRQKAYKLASKSHKQKVAEFNEYLARISEHYDIPKVGPG
ncbi:FAM32A-like protein [Basidiobolus meristosporus CBS 931.73]|uniref:FAM32A-like protein n=1 Tax=Basidiobolus meristosporus CBS 931.73 TaxID=1314790 RepID=A0A1Y1ZDB1_9FUNG|nr:FAM32A-like protein [Basidiobolus meristosporus CBS 931.73]|eukprot:ORY08273.1 FAM32A-like protein [Basidiobolus meristosporus CBS 931.73]